MKWHKLAVYISVFLIIISLLSIFFKGFNYGVDFKGGTLIEISFNKDAPLMKLEIFLKKITIANLQFNILIKSEILIRMPNIVSTNESNLIMI